MENLIKRGDIFFADLGEPIGSEQGGIRPVLVIQNDIGNKYSPATIVAAITSKRKTNLPTHVAIHKTRENGLNTNSTVMLEQIRIVDKERLKGKIGSLEGEDLIKIMEAIKISLAII